MTHFGTTSSSVHCLLGPTDSHWDCLASTLRIAGSTASVTETLAVGVNMVHADSHFTNQKGHIDSHIAIDSCQLHPTLDRRDTSVCCVHCNVKLSDI